MRTPLYVLSRDQTDLRCSVAKFPGEVLPYRHIGNDVWLWLGYAGGDEPPSFLSGILNFAGIDFRPAWFLVKLRLVAALAKLDWPAMAQQMRV